MVRVAPVRRIILLVAVPRIHFTVVGLRGPPPRPGAPSHHRLWRRRGDRLSGSVAAVEKPPPPRPSENRREGRKLRPGRHGQGEGPQPRWRTRGDRVRWLCPDRCGNKKERPPKRRRYLLSLCSTSADSGNPAWQGMAACMVASWSGVTAVEWTWPLSRSKSYPTWLTK